MQFVCDAAPYTWFRIETEGEAARESQDMKHAVERYFKQALQEASESYTPPKNAAIFEQNIGLKAHIQRVMPRFLTLRDPDGKALVTAMLPPEGVNERTLRPIIVGYENCDPYADYNQAIETLSVQTALDLARETCFPYARS
ncbi:MAG: hypothetical protein ACR2PG_12835 [Hyphomicrobiaceae bacterium]